MPVIFGNPLIQSVDEDLNPGPGSSYDMEGNKEYDRRFKVVVKVNGLSHIAVENAPGIPLGGTFYISAAGTEYDTNAILTHKSSDVQDKDDWAVWIVTCHYSTKVKTKQDPSSQNNPEQERPSVSWRREIIQIAPFRDRYERPMHATSKMPFSPPPTIPVAYPILRIGRNELTHNVDKGTAYCHAINSVPFLGYPRGCVQATQVDADQKWKGAYRFWHLDYALRFSPLIHKNKTDRLIVPAGLTADDFMPQIPSAMKTSLAAAYGVTTDELDSYRFLGWQPIYLNQSLYRLRVWPPPDNPGAVGPPPPNVGEPTPILKGPVPIAHPEMLDDLGQVVKKDPITGVREPWYIGFIHYRYLNMNTLVVQGTQD